MRAFCEKVITSVQEARLPAAVQEISLSSSLDSQEGTRLDLREWLKSSLLKIRAKGCNNPQHYRKLLCMCWQWCANGCNNFQQCCDLQCIMGRIQPTRPWVTWVPSPNNVERSGQTDPTMLGYTLAIMEQKEMLGVVSIFAQQLPKTHNNMQQVCKWAQQVTSNNVGSCWPTILRPFAQGCRYGHGSFLFTMRQFSHPV